MLGVPVAAAKRVGLGVGLAVMTLVASGPRAAASPMETRRGFSPGMHTVVLSPLGARQERGSLLVPKEARHSVLVLLVHGGGGQQGTRRDLRPWQDLYARAGYPSLSVDYLLATRTVQAPVYPGPETDVKAAVQYARRNASQLAIDPDRIVVQGFSAGARLGGQLLVTPDSPLFGGASHWPDTSDRIAGFIGFYGYYTGFQFNADRYYGGPPSSRDADVRARWAQADSIAQAPAATGPALLVHGQTDPLPARGSSAFADALRRAGKDAQLEIVPGATHGFDLDLHDHKLTPLGRQVAGDVLRWLGARFPDRAGTRS